MGCARTDIDFTGCSAADLRAVQNRTTVLLRWHGLIGDGFGGFDAPVCEPHVDLLAVLGACETERLAGGFDLARRLAGLIAFALQRRSAFDPSELHLEDALQLCLELSGELLRDWVCGSGIDRTTEGARPIPQETAGSLAVRVQGDDALGEVPGDGEVASQDAGKLDLVEGDLASVGPAVTAHQSPSRPCLDETSRPYDPDSIPPPHVPVRGDQGVTVWRPVLTTLSVHGVASDHNARHLVVREDGVERFRFKLDPDHAAHLAALLAPTRGAQPQGATL